MAAEPGPDRPQYLSSRKADSRVSTAKSLYLSAMVLERVKQILNHLSPFSNGSDVSPYPGLSYHVGRTDKPLKHITIGQLLREQVEINGDNDALVSAWQGIRWTYRELHRRSDELAASFYALGIRKGDRLAIMAGNCGEYVLVTYPAQTMLIIDILR
jgi:non-ribosomal peptide synthetase component F